MQYSPELCQFVVADSNRKEMQLDADDTVVFTQALPLNHDMPQSFRSGRLSQVSSTKYTPKKAPVRSSSVLDPTINHRKNFAQKRASLVVEPRPFADTQRIYKQNISRCYDNRLPILGSPPDIFCDKRLSCKSTLGNRVTKNEQTTSPPIPPSLQSLKRKSTSVINHGPAINHRPHENRKNTMTWFLENCHQYHPHYNPKYSSLYHGDSTNKYGLKLKEFSYEAAKRTEVAGMLRSEFKINNK